MSERDLTAVRALAGRLLSLIDKEESDVSVRKIYELTKDADIDNVIVKIRNEDIRRHVLTGKDAFIRRVADWSPYMVTDQEVIDIVYTNPGSVIDDDVDAKSRMRKALLANQDEMANGRQLALWLAMLLTYRMLALYVTMAATFEEADPEEGREILKQIVATFKREFTPIDA